MNATHRINGDHAANGRRMSAAPDVPPHNRDAERALLSAMLHDPIIIAESVGLIGENDYHIFADCIIHGAIAELHTTGKVVDLVTVNEIIAKQKQIADCGGPGYLAELWEATPSAANFRQHADIIRERSDRRQLLRLARDIEDQAADLGENPCDVLESARRRIEEIATPSVRSSERFAIGNLIERYPRLHPPVIDGLIRERETANIISTSKAGKSWLAYGLALSIGTDRPWLGRYPAAQGRVLLIDNELHRPTIATRIKTVADALAIPLAEYCDAIEVWPLRGNLRNIFAIASELRAAPGFRAIIIDAKYRMMPAGTSENDNGTETAFYNQIDTYAEMTGAAIINIHHASKGVQGDKRVTDVGAGAGAQSRAADCHLVLREHEDDGIVVLDAAVRSFAPVEPMALRWNFPLWQAA